MIGTRTAEVLQRIGTMIITVLIITATVITGMITKTTLTITAAIQVIMAIRNQPVIMVTIMEKDTMTGI